MTDQSALHRTVEELLQEAGERIRTHRVNANLSQDDLAKRAGVSLRTLSKLERTGRSNLETLFRVLRSLGLPEPLNALVPVPQVRPMALLRAMRADAMPKRVRRKRGTS